MGVAFFFELKIVRSMPVSVVIRNYDIIQGLRRNVLDGNVG